MEYYGLLADDQGICASEVLHILSGTGGQIKVCSTMEECIELARNTHPSFVIVYTGMKRAFSLIRILRHSDDLKSIPLIVVAEPDQEKIIEKHRQLPSRADRYLLRPLDPQLLKSVIEDVIGTTEIKGVMPPQTPEEDVIEGEPADAFSKVEEELTAYRKKVSLLEKDLKAALAAAQQLAEVEEEAKKLRAEIQSLREKNKQAEVEREMFGRLEEEYRQTISELRQIIERKDREIEAMRQALSGKEADAARISELEQENKALKEEIQKLKHSIETMVSILAKLDKVASELPIPISDAIEICREEPEEVSPTPAFDEATVVMDIESIKQRLQPEVEQNKQEESKT